MASLQIRNLPPEVYEALVVRAKRANRSLAQQAIADLRRVPELEGRDRRLEILGEIQRDIEQNGTHDLPVPPEELIRQDRDR